MEGVGTVNKHYVETDIVYFWTNKDGVKINVDHMDVNHLRNVLKLLMRNQKIKQESILDAYQQGWHDCEKYNGIKL